MSYQPPGLKVAVSVVPGEPGGRPALLSKLRPLRSAFEMLRSAVTFQSSLIVHSWFQPTDNSSSSLSYLSVRNTGLAPVQVKLFWPRTTPEFVR